MISNEAFVLYFLELVLGKHFVSEFPVHVDAVCVVKLVSVVVPVVVVVGIVMVSANNFVPVIINNPHLEVGVLLARSSESSPFGKFFLDLSSDSFDMLASFDVD